MPIEKKPQAAQALLTNSRFKRYAVETEKALRQGGLRQEQAIIRIADAWSVFDRELDVEKSPESDDNYDLALRLVPKGSSAEDVTAFSILMGEFAGSKGFGQKIGVFLSALVNTGKDGKYLVHTFHIGRRIDALGFRNEKKVLINGDAGGDAGGEMIGGSLDIMGDTGECPGICMKEGTIVVHGDCKGFAGQWMNGGELTIMGESGRMAGDEMKGGKLILKGAVEDMEGLGRMMDGGEIHLGVFDDPGQILSNVIWPMTIERGKIFHQGKLVFER